MARLSVGLPASWQAVCQAVYQAAWQAVSLSLCLSLCVTGSDVVFTRAPATVTPLATDVLTLRCSLKASDVPSTSDPSDVTSTSDMSFLASIVITKSGVDVATVSSYLSAQVYDNGTGVEVTGEIPGQGGQKGYLEVRWTNPGPDQTGSYECLVAGFDQRGHPHSYSRTVDVVGGDVAMADVIWYVKHLKAEMENLKTNKNALELQMNNVTLANAAINAINAEMKLEMDNLQTSNNALKSEISFLNSSNADMKLEMDALRTANNDLKAEISYLNLANSGLNSSIAALKTKQDTQVMFTAYLIPVSANVSGGAAVVFDGIITNIGNAYNPSTGEFTSPVDGDYVFYANILRQEYSQAHVFFKHNNQRIGGTGAEATYKTQSASNTVTLRLKQGDTVSVVGVVSPYSSLAGPNDTTFSGYLVAAL